VCLYIERREKSNIFTWGMKKEVEKLSEKQIDKEQKGEVQK
jgi:hypothetical protein